MRSFAGLENEHSNMLQVDTESLHPHWHCMRAPTRRTSALGFSETVWATAPATTRTASERLLFHHCIFLGKTYYFRAGVLQFDLARNQANQRAANQHQAADPNP